VLICPPTRTGTTGAGGGGGPDEMIPPTTPPRTPPTAPPSMPPLTPPSTPAPVDVVSVVASVFTSVGVSSGTVSSPGFGSTCATGRGSADRAGAGDGSGGGGGGADGAAANAMIVCTSGSVFVARSSGMPTTSASTTTCSVVDTTFDPGARSRSGRSIVPAIKSNMVVVSPAERRATHIPSRISCQNGQVDQELDGTAEKEAG